MNKDEIKEMFNKIMILEQELETYKKGYKSIEANNQQLKLHLKIYKTDLDKLQDRIDKAIEYINYATENNDIDELKKARHLLLFNEDLDKLLNILQGKSDE